jgi:endonuclease G
MELLQHVLRNDQEIRDELAVRTRRARLPYAVEADVSLDAVEGAFESARTGRPVAGMADPRAEAVILLEGRPSLLVKDDTFQQPASPTWRARLADSESRLRRAILSVGRIELVDHPLAPLAPFVGTGWVVGEDTIVTNRHVVVVFGLSQGDTFRFQIDPASGRDVTTRIDFREEHDIDVEKEIGIAKILHIEAEPGVDMAFLKLDTTVPLPQPIVLGDHRDGEFVATIGYPGRDRRVAGSEIRHIFRDIFNVKRLAPGMVMIGGENGVFRHDCSTLKGSSGSIVVSLDSGRAVGLHFAGEFGFANSAVSAQRLKEKLGEMSISIRASWPVPPAPPVDSETESAESRDGYQPDFLGTEVPMPGLNADAALELPSGGRELKYTHFSVVMHAERKLAISSACNIDGRRLRRVPRDNRWRLDGRVPLDRQIGNELYRQNPYDRGHMVRGLSPVWGDEETASRANDDTFFYTNAAPQHERLNQKFWVGLEDYILDHAEADDMRVSVFTGPIFDPGDPEYRGVLIPRQFWKIVVFREGGGGPLRASGYLMDQSHFIIDMPEEFAFGAYKTYQVALNRIATSAALDIGDLMEADVLHRQESFALTPISRFEDVVF